MARGWLDIKLEVFFNPGSLKTFGYEGQNFSKSTTFLKHLIVYRYLNLIETELFVHLDNIFVVFKVSVIVRSSSSKAPTLCSHAYNMMGGVLDEGKAQPKMFVLMSLSH